MSAPGRPEMPEWQKIALAHHELQRKNIPAEWLLSDDRLDELRGVGTPNEGRLIKLHAAKESELLSHKELDITENYTAQELLTKISAGQLSSLEVTVAFSKRAAVAQQLTSCLTEIFFDRAMDRARELDEYFQRTGTVQGPLHGLPISLKDSLKTGEHHACVGYTKFLQGPIPKEKSALVKLLLDAGAVLYCKTNLPQTMMTADSENHVFGRTLNPHNTALTAGGSTGGEGALIAFRGSPLGVGSDIAGSIRIPSLCCGIYGFKPTPSRVPYSGQNDMPVPRPRLPNITAAAGPMANSVEDLEMFMQAVISQRPWKYDIATVDIPWRRVHSETNKKLTIGVLPEDPDYVLYPPVRRALRDAAEALQAAGHKVIELPQDPLLSVSRGSRIAFAYFGLGQHGFDSLEKELGEPLINSVRRGVHPFTTGPSPIANEPDLMQQITRLYYEREDFCNRWRQSWIEHDIDVLIAPSAQSTAPPHDEYGVPAYTLIWNLTEYPACSIPYGFASKQKDPDYVPAKLEFEPDYKPDAVDGAPCAIQIITPKFRDEECLDATRIIDSILNFKKIV